MAANGMITRHFEHPSGATATLEMPAGWSRNCWFELRTVGKNGAANPVNRETFGTPEEARQAAIVKERQALANGWKPKMATSIEIGRSRDWSIHRPTGERMPLEITEIRDTSETVSAISPFRGGAIVRSKTIDFTAIGQTMLSAGDRFLIQQRELAKQNVLAAFFAERVTSQHEMSGGGVTNHIKATMTAMDDGEAAAIELWHNREAIIQEAVESNSTLVELWGWLGSRIQETSERQQVQAAIIRGRAERQARLQREQEQEAMRRAREEAAEIDRQREAARRIIESTSRPLIRITPEHERRLRQQQTEDTLRKLSGGTDLSKPKKRKIDLGE